MTADERSLIEKLNDRADRWQTWIDDDLPTEVGYSPDNMRYHQSLDRAAVGEIQRLTSELALIQGVAALRNVVNAQFCTERDEARAEVSRLMGLMPEHDTRESYRCTECGAFHLRPAADVPAPKHQCTFTGTCDNEDPYKCQHHAGPGNPCYCQCHGL